MSSSWTSCSDKASRFDVRQCGQVDGAACFTISGDSDGYICVLQPTIGLRLNMLRKAGAEEVGAASMKTIFVQAALQSNVYGDLLADTESSVLTIHIDMSTHNNIATQEVCFFLGWPKFAKHHHVQTPMPPSFLITPSNRQSKALCQASFQRIYTCKNTYCNFDPDLLMLWC